MGNRKYEFTGEIRPFCGIVLRRIRAVKDIQCNSGLVAKGTIGGWIQSESNLSRRGNCWVGDKAMVYGNAKVMGNAEVLGDSAVYGNAVIRENAKIYEDAFVGDEAEIYDSARVHGHAVVHGLSFVHDNADVFDYAEITSYSEIFGNAKICCAVTISGDCQIGDDALVCKQYDLLYISPVAKLPSGFTFYRTTNQWINVSYEKEIVSIDDFVKKSAQYEHSDIIAMCANLAIAHINLS